MSDASDPEDIEAVRERKLAELKAKADEDEPATTTATATEPIHLDAGEELSSVLADHEVVLVDFYADWCGPCKQLEPIVASLAESTAATVLKVDVDEHQALAGEYGVRGVPTLLLVVDGEVAERVVGVQDEARLRSLIERHAP